MRGRARIVTVFCFIFFRVVESPGCMGYSTPKGSRECPRNTIQRIEFTRFLRVFWRTGVAAVCRHRNGSEFVVIAIVSSKTMANKETKLALSWSPGRVKAKNWRSSV